MPLGHTSVLQRRAHIHGVPLGIPKDRLQEMKLPRHPGGLPAHGHAAKLLLTHTFEEKQQDKIDDHRHENRRQAGDGIALRKGV